MKRDHGLYEHPNSQLNLAELSQNWPDSYPPDVLFALSLEACLTLMNVMPLMSETALFSELDDML